MVRVYIKIYVISVIVNNASFSAAYSRGLQCKKQIDDLPAVAHCDAMAMEWDLMEANTTKACR